MNAINIQPNDLTKTHLIKLVHKLQLSEKRLKGKIQKLENQKKGLELELGARQTKESIDKNNRKSKRAELESPNIDYLERALSVFEDFLDRPFESKDYRKFVRYLLKVYPCPAYIQEPRLTPEEKRLSPELQEEARELKRRTGWNEGRLRKFFHEKTGIKASTKK